MIKVRTEDGSVEVNNVTEIHVTNDTLSEPSPGVAEVAITAASMSIADKLYFSENFQ